MTIDERVPIEEIVLTRLALIAPGRPSVRLIGVLDSANEAPPSGATRVEAPIRVNLLST